jgi:hypothetical protein
MTHLPMIADTTRGLHFAAGVGWCIAHDGASVPLSEHPSAALGLLEWEYAELRAHTGGAGEPFPYALCVRMAFAGGSPYWVDRALAWVAADVGSERTWTGGLRADLSQVAAAGRSLPQATRHVARKLLARIPAVT